MKRFSTEEVLIMGGEYEKRKCHIQKLVLDNKRS